MYGEFSPGLSRALEAARRWAGLAQASAVEPIHLLYGLVEDPEGRVADLLARAGIDRSAFPSASADETAEGTALPWAEGVHRILYLARATPSGLSGDRTLASDQVLFAMVQEDAAVREKLEEWGLPPAQLRSDVLAVRDPTLPMDEPLETADPVEKTDAARVLDAAANRAREGLRVLEDYCRFVLDDGLLTRELKEIRHGLTEAVGRLDRPVRLEARETRTDVGVNLTTAGEGRRDSLVSVALANGKRLQEALRSLEEFSKPHDPQAAAALEQLRYRAYTVERSLALTTRARERLGEVRLYLLITGQSCSAAVDWTIREAAAGGARMVQLREKGKDDRWLLQRAREVRRWTREAGVLFILNDRPDIARLAEADGVHLGQEDLPVKEARRILGAGAIIGVSTHDVDQVRQAVLDGATYIGVGPVFPSGTKTFPTLSGLEFLRQASAETSLPAFAIGGIRPDNIDAVRDAGGRRVAVSQAVCQADDPRAAAAALRQALAAGPH